MDTHGLPIGMRLGEFEITERLGEGGFSIVYLAWDHSLDRKIALKEYMPSSIATRMGTTQVSPRERHRETFELGLKSFINEGKLLAHFDHPSLVKVYRFWEANGTAYMVMPFYEGVTVKDTVRALPAPPDETWLRELLAPLTAALCVIHADNCYHRDIAPDNVILLAGSHRPLLLDFGAARRVIGDMTQALTVILKPGYAPVEQYAEVPGMKQGPWTDVYALGATVYWAIMGKAPPPSVGRMLRDSHVPLAEAAAGRYSQDFLQAIDRALAIMPEQRTPSIEAFRQDLGLDARTAPPAAPAMHWADPDATVIRSPTTVSKTRAGATASPAAPLTAFEPRPPAQTTPAPVRAAPEARTSTERAPPPPPPATPVPEDGIAAQQPALPHLPPRGRPPVAMLVGVVAMSAIVAGGIWWAMRDKADAVVPASPQSTSPAVPAPAPAPATPEVSAAPAPQAAPTAPAASATAEPTAPPTPSVAATPAPAPAPSEPKVARVTKPATPKAERKPEESGNRDECARIMSQLSIGDSSPALMERFRALKCR